MMTQEELIRVGVVSDTKSPAREREANSHQVAKTNYLDWLNNKKIVASDHFEFK